jgi:hypothetical protein
MTKIARDVFGDRRVTPDSLILPFNTLDYLKLNRPETYRYAEVGERGPNMYFGQGYLFQVDGLEIFQSSTFPMLDSETNEDPLIRTRTIGEFGDSLYEDNAVEDPDKYHSSLRNRTIHDNVTDTLREIKFTEMIFYSGLFEHDPAGEMLPSEDIGRPFFQGFPTIGDYLSKHDKWLTRVVKFIDHHYNKAGAQQSFKDEWDALVTDAKVGEDIKGASGTSFMTAASRTKTADRYGMLPMGDDDEDESSSSTPSRSEYREYKINIKDDLPHLKQPEMLSLDGRTKEGEPYAGVFMAYKNSSSTPSDRSFTRDQLEILRNGLLREYEKNGYDVVSRLPWVQTLQYLLHDKTGKVYDTYINDMDHASEFLKLLYQDHGLISSRYTSGYLVKASDRKSIEAAAAKQMVPLDANAIAQRANQLANMYPEVNRVLPRFLPGIFVELLNHEGSVAAEQKTKAIIPMARRIADWIDMTRHRGQVTAQTTFSGDTRPHDLLLRILQNIGSYRQIALLANWCIANEVLVRDWKGDSIPQVLSDLVAELNDTAKTEHKPYAGGAAGTAKGIHNALFRMRITGKIFKFFEEHNIPYPVDFTFARPMMQYEMGSAIMCKRGFETGATFFGEPNFQLTNDGNRKVLYGYFTCYAGARVLRRDNVHILHNVTCKRYVSGGGTLFLNPLSPTDRANFAQGMMGGRDMFSIPFYPGERLRDNSFDLCGGYCDDLDDGHNNSTHSKDQHYAMAETFAGTWGMRQRDHYFDIEYHKRQENGFNTLVFRMPQYMPKVNENNNINPRGYHKQGQGHWGKLIYNGIKKDRMGLGENGYVKLVDYHLESTILVS